MSDDPSTAERIKHLTFNGKPVDPQATFLVATNNYRAYGGKFAGTGDEPYRLRLTG